MTKRLFTLIPALLGLLIGSYVTASGKAASEQTEQAKTGKMYLMSDNQMKDVDELLAMAKASNKLALIAMGANWCHDSQSLAKKLHLPEVHEGIKANYELLFVDVGYLTHIKEVITRFGQPVIYATPTVLIIDPNTNLQLNKDNMHQWRDAAKISVQDSIKYFAEVSDNREARLEMLNKQKANNVGKLKQLNQQIDVFEQQQAERLYSAFAVIGPLLEQDEKGEEAKDFRKHWKAVAKFRYKITGQLKKLREQAIEIASFPEQKGSLEFPTYLAFGWE